MDRYTCSPCMHRVCQVPLKLDELICLLHGRPCHVTVAHSSTSTSLHTVSYIQQVWTGMDVNRNLRGLLRHTTMRLFYLENSYCDLSAVRWTSTWHWEFWQSLDMYYGSLKWSSGPPLWCLSLRWGQRHISQLIRRGLRRCLSSLQWRAQGRR